MYNLHCIMGVKETGSEAKLAAFESQLMAILV